MKQIIKKFTGTLEYATYLSKAQTSKTFASERLSSQLLNRSWSMTSFEDADKMLRLGDKENAERIAKRVAQVNRMNGSGYAMRAKQFNDVVGHAVHVPNFLTGVPTTMINTRKVSIRSSKVLNVVYNCTFPFNTDLDSVVEAGVKVLTYIRDLESKGYRVNLWAMMSAKGNREHITCMVRIKDSEQYLNITKTAYPIINPNWLRRHFVRLIECEVSDSYFVGSYGRVISSEHDVKDALKELRFKVDKYLSYESVSRMDKIQ